MGKFNELVPILTSTDRVYISCIGRAMLHPRKTGGQPHLICIIFNAVTELWSTGWHQLGPRRLTTFPRDDAVWCSGEGTQYQWTQMAWWCWTQWWLVEKSRISIPEEAGDTAAVETWSEIIRIYWPALGLSVTRPSDRTAWSGALRSAVILDPPYTRD